MSGWMKILLGVSLAANMVFVGLMGGKLLHDGKRERRGDPPGAFLAALSEERAEEVRAHFKEMREQRRASRSGMRESWAKVREAVKADPFDKAALEAALDAISDARDASSRARYAKMATFMASLSTEERRAFSDAMAERWKRRRERRRNPDNN